MRIACALISSRLKERCTRFADGGRLATDSPGRHSVAGRIGRGTNPPPQFGQTFCSVVATQSAQNVHSKEQMRASVEAGARSRSQHSQFERHRSPWVFGRESLAPCAAKNMTNTPRKRTRMLGQLRLVPAPAARGPNAVFRLLRATHRYDFNVSPGCWRRRAL